MFRKLSASFRNLFGKTKRRHRRSMRHKKKRTMRRMRGG